MYTKYNNNNLITKIIIILIIVAIIVLLILLLKKYRINDIPILNKDITLEVGDTEQIKINSNINVTYKSNNENIALVSEDGIVKALKYGYTTITVSYNEKIKTNVNIKVTDNSKLKVENVDIITSNQLSKAYVKKNDKLVIKVTFNHDINIKPKLMINNEEINFQYNPNIDNIVFDKTVQDETELILNIYLENDLLYTYNLPKIDNQIPTCTMKYENETIIISGEDNNEIEKYSITKTKNPVYTLNKELKTTDYGTWYGFIRDYAGNVGECTIKIRDPKTIIDPASITIVGDSRMEDLCRRSWYKAENGTCIAEISKGYNWLNTTAIKEVNKLSPDKKRFIVTNLGVNDYHRIKEYVKRYEELALTDWKDSILVLLSVNPTKDSRSNLNPHINSFNSELILLASKYDNITYCDSNSYLKQIGFQSNDGVHYTSNTDKDIYNYMKQCIQDFYK